MKSGLSFRHAAFSFLVLARLVVAAGLWKVCILNVLITPTTACTCNTAAFRFRWLMEVKENIDLLLGISLEWRSSHQWNYFKSRVN